MNAWKTISVALTASTTGYSAGLSKAAGETEAFGKTVESTASKSALSWQSFGNIAAKGAVVFALALAGAVKEAAGFDRAMHNVASLGNESASMMRRLSDETLSMSKRLPQSAEQLAEGLYDIESSGFEGAGALKVLNASAEAASAGLSTTETAARAVTGALNAYGMGADKAQDVSDILFQAVNLGVVSFEELAQGMGDWVSTAAAAGVSLRDASAAMATITLAGIPAAEAGTALNRVIQSFVKPSDAMAATMQNLGISLADLKNPSIGLTGVMEKLRVATGGNIVAASALFPEIRSLKGALALWANEGQNAKRVLDGMADSSGATKRAFDEQMRSFSAQITLLKNNAEAFAITVGLKLIPVLQEGGRIIGRVLVEAGRALRPVWEDLVDTAKHLGGMLGDVARFAAPAARALGLLAGAAVVGALRAVAATLSAITATLAEHPALVHAVVAAFGALAATRAISAVTTGLQTMSTLLDVAAVKAYDLAGKFTAANFGQAAGIGLVTVALAGLVGGIADADQYANNLRSSLHKLGSTDGIDGLQKWADASKQAAQSMRDQLDSYGGAGSVTQGIVGGFQLLASALPGVDAKILNHVKGMAAASDEWADAQTQLTRVRNAMATLAGTYGLTTDQVGRLLDKDNDLNLQTATSDEIFASLAKTMQSVQKEVGTGAAITKQLIDTMDPDAIQAFTDGLTDAVSKAQQAVGKFFDPADMVKGLKDGESLTASAVRAFYAKRLDQANTFTRNIAAATAAGYDPQMISNLIQQGPATAGPILAALVSDTSAAMVQTVNDAQKAISDVQAKAAQMARLTYLATSSSTDALAKELSDASAIVQASWEGLKPVDIADKLGMTPDAFNKIVDDFGLTMGKIQTVAKKPAVVKVDTTQGQRDALSFGGFLDTQIAKVRNAPVNPVVSPGTTQQAENALEWVTRSRTVEVALHIGAEIAATLGSSVAALAGGRRWGGVDYAYATGGVTPAHIAAGTRIRYAEPETGGEAYVPRIGNPARSLSILRTAAGWYGAQVVPGGGGGSSVSLTIPVDARGATDPAATAAAVRDAVNAAVKRLVANPRPLVDATARYQKAYQ